ncbi:hypothetical protein PRNP1_001697 [Phytophthora ramorum]
MPPALQELKLVMFSIISLGFVDNFIMIITRRLWAPRWACRSGTVKTPESKGITISGLGLGNMVEGFCAWFRLAMPTQAYEQSIDSAISCWGVLRMTTANTRQRTG